MTGEMRAGIVLGALSFISNLLIGLSGNFIFAPLFGVIWGVGAGIYSVIQTEDSESASTAAATGAKAGAIAGVGAFLGLAIGLTIWFNMLGGQQEIIDLAVTVAENQDIESTELTITEDFARFTLLVTTGCFGFLSLALFASAAAIGAHFYDSSKRDRD